MATYSKPSTLARAVKGVFFGTIRNLVDTFNWLVSCWDNIGVGNGLKLSGALEGKPRINLNLTAAAGLEIVDNGGGELQIRLNGSGGSSDEGGSIVVGYAGGAVSGVRVLTFSDSGNVKFGVDSNGDGEAVITARATYA
jgi:hypothetical protein